MAEYYPLIKQIHLACVVLTLLSFVLRGIARLRGSLVLNQRWVRIVPHLIDTLLLASGLALAIILQQSPFVHAWLTAKFFALIAYIVLGSLALKHCQRKTAQAAAFAGALAAFAYLVLVARQHTPTPQVWPV